MMVDTSSWAKFKYEDIFEIKKGKRLTKEDFVEGSTPFIGAIDSNNGYRDFIGQEAIHESNTITVNYNGSVGEAFYQPIPFCASDDVNVLYPKFSFNKYIAMFIIPLIRKEKYRFNYGRKWESNRMKESIILLPVTNKGEVDIDYMENYIKSLKNVEIIESKFNDKIKKSVINKDVRLSTKKWNYYHFSDLFDIEKGERLTIYDRLKESENIPLLTATAENNGVVDYISFSEYKDTKKTFENKITIDMFFNTFYHPYKYFSDDNVHTLIPKFNSNEFVSLFFVGIFKKLQYKYSFGRQARIQRIIKEKIYLPSGHNEPDFEFMENYIKTLPYSASL
jgi:hypothetical protein